jgi:hypothetical protein
VYGKGDFEDALEWLGDLGWPPQVIGEDDIGSLTATALLVLPNTYVFSPEAAAQLADFVQRGGGAIFIDGSTRAMELKEIRDLTGMQARGRRFQETMALLAGDPHPLIPASTREVDLATFEQRDAQFKEFRREGVSALVEQVYRTIKATHPDVEISVTVTGDQESAANRVFQDWAAWLQGDYVDLLIPRMYVDTIDELPPLIAVWQRPIDDFGRISLGLISFTESGDTHVSKPAQQLLEEIDLVRSAGVDGVVIFDLDEISQEQLQALAGQALAR